MTGTACPHTLLQWNWLHGRGTSVGKYELSTVLMLIKIILTWQATQSNRGADSSSVNASSLGDSASALHEVLGRAHPSKARRRV